MNTYIEQPFKNIFIKFQLKIENNNLMIITQFQIFRKKKIIIILLKNNIYNKLNKWNIKKKISQDN